MIAPVGKEIITHSIFIRSFQKAGRDNLIGINIAGRDDDETGGKRCELRHKIISNFEIVTISAG
jgi:hypothetical protein